MGRTVHVWGFLMQLLACWDRNEPYRCNICIGLSSAHHLQSSQSPLRLWECLLPNKPGRFAIYRPNECLESRASSEYSSYHHRLSYVIWTLPQCIWGFIILNVFNQQMHSNDSFHALQTRLCINHLVDKSKHRNNSNGVSFLQQINISHVEESIIFCPPIHTVAQR